MSARSGQDGGPANLLHAVRRHGTLRFMMESVLASSLESVRPHLPLLVALGVLLLVFTAPLPGRGPGWFKRRDPWRGFKFASRRSVMTRAGGQCEAPVLLAWGRCREQATEADHICPWSRGGPTIVSNGQALCRTHNRRKSNVRPAWWYVTSLERRRARYVSPETEVRVLARMSADDRAVRAAGGPPRRQAFR